MRLNAGMRMNPKLAYHVQAADLAKESLYMSFYTKLHPSNLHQPAIHVFRKLESFSQLLPTCEIYMSTIHMSYGQTLGRVL